LDILPVSQQRPLAGLLADSIVFVWQDREILAF
jgi:hypothetical protein